MSQKLPFERAAGDGAFAPEWVHERAPRKESALRFVAVAKSGGLYRIDHSADNNCLSIVTLPPDRVGTNARCLRAGRQFDALTYLCSPQPVRRAPADERDF